jgi:hypothetical protein
VASEDPDYKEDIPDAPPDIQGDASYTIRTWFMFRTHHVFPRAGGYDDQDPVLMDDWHILNLYYTRARNGVYSSVVLGHADAAAWRDSGLMDG